MYNSLLFMKAAWLQYNRPDNKTIALYNYEANVFPSQYYLEEN